MNTVPKDRSFPMKSGYFGPKHGIQAQDVIIKASVLSRQSCRGNNQTRYGYTGRLQTQTATYSFYGTDPDAWI